MVSQLVNWQAESDGRESRKERRGEAGEAGLTIQESSWLMGISRCPVREEALEWSHKKTSSCMCLSLRVCERVCAKQRRTHTSTCAPPWVYMLVMILTISVSTPVRHLCFSTFIQTSGLHFRGQGYKDSLSFDICTAGKMLMYSNSRFPSNNSDS